MASTPGPTFGELLRRHRLAAGLTQEQLAERASLSVRGISDLERGRRLRARSDTIALLAKALGLAKDEAARLSATVWADVDVPPAEEAVGTPTPPNRARHNLPASLTSFVGRAIEVVALQERLRTARLVTLTGPGGSGKTRLALEVAAGLPDCFLHGVWLVELAALADAALVPEVVAGVLGLVEAPGRPVLAGLVEHLRGRDVLLVLDNSEHLVEECARLAEALLRGGPNVRIR